jgi:hypothetical protein
MSDFDDLEAAFIGCARTAVGVVVLRDASTDPPDERLIPALRAASEAHRQAADRCDRMIETLGKM